MTESAYRSVLQERLCLEKEMLYDDNEPEVTLVNCMINLIDIDLYLAKASIIKKEAIPKNIIRMISSDFKDLREYNEGLAYFNEKNAKIKSEIAAKINAAKKS